MSAKRSFISNFIENIRNEMDKNKEIKVDFHVLK